MLQIRLTLYDEDFFPWSDILKHRPDYLPAWISKHEEAAREKGETDFSRWRCRTTALPIDRIKNVEAKSTSGPWFDVPPNVPVLIGDSDSDGITGISIKSHVYLSKRIDGFGPHKVTGYEPRRIPLWEWNKIKEMAA